MLSPASHLLDGETLIATIEQCLRQQPDGNHAIAVLRLRHLDRWRIDYGYFRRETRDIAIAALLAGILRHVDRWAWLADDSIALLLPGLLSHNHARLAAARLQRALNSELRVDGRNCRLECVFGVAFSDGSAADTLLREADRAAAEALLHDQFWRVAEAPTEGASLQVDELRDALAHNRLAVWFQPILDTTTGQLVGVESLARWDRGHAGTISPAQFVPFAEQTNLIGELTRWSLHNSLRLGAELRRQHPEVALSINLSPKAFHEDDIVEQILAGLDLWAVPAQHCVLEVTESAVMRDPRRSQDVLQRLQVAGLGIAIDDFGTGYSSFVYLQKFPVSELKLDQSFVQAVGSDARSLHLVEAMILLAQRLGLKVVAEGVEDAETLRLLAELGCDYVQGFLLGRPQPADGFCWPVDH